MPYFADSQYMMWRRWNNNNSREPAISEPQLYDTSLDEGYLETIPEVESIISRPTSMATTHALPDLPFRSVPPMSDNDPVYRHSTVSSVYSQPSPTIPRREDAREEPRSAGTGEVSPMSTPRSSVDFAASDISVVSPMDSTFNIPARAPQTEPTRTSHIPRPIPPIATKSPDSDLQSPTTRVKKQDTKWDEYSGEPTTADTGKPSSVKPGNQPLEMQYPQLKERTKLILAGLRERDNAKKNTWGKQPPPVAADPLDDPPPVKEPWKGSSGRTTLVEPVKNTPAARSGPIQFPQRNVSRMPPAADRERTKSPETAAETNTSVIPPTRAKSPEEALPQQRKSESSRKPIPAPIEVPKPDNSIRVVASQESIKPTAPLKIKNPQSRTISETENLNSLQSPFHSPKPVPQQRQTIDTPGSEWKTPRADSVQPIEPSEPSPTTPTNNQRPAVQEPQHLGIVHEPASRFSWTTYATTVNESPRSLAPTQMDSSPVPPMSSIPAPIVVKKRPVSTTAVAPPFSNVAANQSRSSIVTRKPISNDRNRSTSMMTSVSKSLPPTPVELQAGDKISTLEARLDDLSRRRRNINKVDRQLNDNLKRNAIEYSFKKRKEVEKKISSLAIELDDITREEHDIGMQLHRAKKKRDQDDDYENPTGLWIKRVTS